MRLYDTKAAGIPEYTNMLKDAQKKATRANLPMSNDVLVMIATKSLMEANTFPNETHCGGSVSSTKNHGWNGKPTTLRPTKVTSSTSVPAEAMNLSMVLMHPPKGTQHHSSYHQLLGQLPW